LPKIASSVLVAPLAVGLATVIVALIIVPVRVWHQPATDAVYKGFDPNLMFISLKGPAPNAGQVNVTNHELAILAVTDSHPTVHLLTTPLSFSTSFDAEIVAGSPPTVPLRVEVWSPETNAGYALVFDGDGSVIRAETITNSTSGKQDLVGGDIRSTNLGPFEVAHSYHVVIQVDQTNRTITTQVGSPGAPLSESKVTPAEAPELFKAFRYTLTMSSSTQSVSTEVLIHNFTLAIPHQPFSTAEEVVKVDDARVRALVLVLWVASILLCLVIGASRVPPMFRQRSVAGLRFVGRRLKSRTAFLLVLALVVYLVGNQLLFRLGSLHYDILSAKVWAYVAYASGITDLYYRTVLVPAAGAWSGVPVHEAGFPYGFTKAYYYLTIGWAYHLWPGASNVPVNDFSYEFLLKSANVVFGFADGILTFLILRPMVGKTNAFTSALLLAVNPAVVLVMSIWGSTETISVFFVLSSILLAEKNRPLGAWLLLAAAAYTRPQMFVLGFLLGAVYVRKFGLPRNLMAISWTVVLAFVLIGPFALAISPSVPVDYIARTLIFHFGNGQADLPYLGTSPGYYSFWTLPLLLVNNQHGLGRMWSPSTQDLIGSLTYGQVGAGLSVAFLLAIGALLLISKKVSDEPGRYLPLVAFGMLGWLMLTPGLISRYFVYGIVGIILCRKVFSSTGYLLTVAVLTVITVVTAWGHLGLDFLGYSGNASVLSPTNNAVSHFVFSLFSADVFISIGTAANVGVLALIGVKAWDSMRGDRPPELRQTAPAPAL